MGRHLSISGTILFPPPAGLPVLSLDPACNTCVKLIFGACRIPSSEVFRKFHMRLRQVLIRRYQSRILHRAVPPEIGNPVLSIGTQKVATFELRWAAFRRHTSAVVWQKPYLRFPFGTLHLFKPSPRNSSASITADASKVANLL